LGHGENPAKEEVIVAEAFKKDDEGNTWIRVSEIPRFMRQPQAVETEAQESVYMSIGRVILGFIAAIWAFSIMPDVVGDVIVGLLILGFGLHVGGDGFDQLKEKFRSRG
jgi:hypothetical protein